MQNENFLKKCKSNIRLFLARLRGYGIKVAQDTNPVSKIEGEAGSDAHRPYLRCMYGGYKPSWWSGATFLVLLFGMLLFNSCKPKQVIVEGRTEIVYQYLDSTRYHDSTVYIPVERYVDIVPVFDTLKLETTLAHSEAWYDSTLNSIKGRIWNLKAVEYKYIEVETVKVKDSIVEREKPVPYDVEVVKTHIPSWAWITLVWSLLTVASIVWGIYRRLKP